MSNKIEVSPLFKTNMLNSDGLKKAAEIGLRFQELVSWLEGHDICLLGRELSIAMTKLEEACFFAKKAMAKNAINQVGHDVEI